MAKFFLARTICRFYTPGERRLPYVAMTRAIDRQVMTCRGPSSFTRKIQDSIGSVRQHLDEMDLQKAAG
ncbi:hypothetical protein [Pseudomonas sp.]|uniref:hypothetical protein n=1 Tax=Pseudomonas sp. TaxID=306 RepID=UPI0032636DCF